MKFLIVYSLGAIPLLVLLGIGRRVDRWAVVAIVGSVLVETLLGSVHWGTWRAGVAISNTLLFLALWGLAERGDRWWLILGAASQLLTVVSHLWPLITQGIHTWSGVSLRRALWLAMTGFFYFGALEAWLSRRLAREARSDDSCASSGGYRNMA